MGLTLFVFLNLLSLSASAATTFKCLACGMDVAQGAKGGFESKKEQKPVHLCSFACAQAFHKRAPETPLFAYDFSTGNQVDVKLAYFLVKSKNILKEVEFGMPPFVAAFSDEISAKKTQTRLKDAEVVKGYEALEKALK